MNTPNHDDTEPSQAPTRSYPAPAAPTARDPNAPNPTPAPAPLTDSLILDLDADPKPTPERYTHSASLGRGGMGEVDLWHDHTLGRNVARKTLAAPLNRRPDYRRRFLREIQVQAQLEHPSIVPVFDSGRDAQGRVYFTMRRIQGTTLAEAIRALAHVHTPAERHRERSRLLSAFLQACLAVDYAHHRGVVHRDLKPHNMMLGSFGEVYVLDWGIAKVIGAPLEPLEPVETDDTPLALSTQLRAQTQGPLAMGTPGYMAPEQRIDASLATPRSDVYAMGATLFHILALEPLRPPSAAPLTAALDTDALAPSLRAPHLDLPGELDVICQTACALDPDARYPSLRALHDAVEAVLRGDRDMALRRQLADAHVLRALTSPSADAHVLRETSRALALDPTHEEAAKLLTATMLKPPDHEPQALRDERAHAEAIDSRRALLTNAASSGAVVAALLALLPMIDVLDWRILLTCALVVAFGGVILAITNTGAERTPAAIARSSLVGLSFSAPIALSATAFGPFVLPPLITLAVCVLVAAVVDIGWRRLNVIAAALLTLAGTYLAYALEGPALGFHLSPTGLTAAPTLLAFSHPATYVAFALFSLTLILAATLAIWNNTTALVRSRRKLHSYEWRLRQVTSPTPTTPHHPAQPDDSTPSPTPPYWTQDS